MSSGLLFFAALVGVMRDTQSAELPDCVVDPTGRLEWTDRRGAFAVGPRLIGLDVSEVVVDGGGGSSRRVRAGSPFFRIQGKLVSRWRAWGASGQFTIEEGLAWLPAVLRRYPMDGAPRSIDGQVRVGGREYSLISYFGDTHGKGRLLMVGPDSTPCRQPVEVNWPLSIEVLKDARLSTDISVHFSWYEIEESRALHPLTLEFAKSQQHTVYIDAVQSESQKMGKSSRFEVGGNPARLTIAIIFGASGAGVAKVLPSSDAVEDLYEWAGAPCFVVDMELYHVSNVEVRVAVQKQFFTVIGNNERRWGEVEFKGKTVGKTVSSGQTVSGVD